VFDVHAVVLGAKDVLLEFVGAGSPLDRAIERGLDKAAALGLSAARGRANPQWSGVIEVRGSTGRRVITWSRDRWYLNFVENGRSAFGVGGTARVDYRRGGRREGNYRSHSAAKVLHFVVNGQDVFTRHVGPIVAHPFMGPAEELVESKIAQILTDEVNASRV
jgi:hypothetical protein